MSKRCKNANHAGNDVRFRDKNPPAKMKGVATRYKIVNKGHVELRHSAIINSSQILKSTVYERHRKLIHQAA
ncbi:hypothetical protein P691DRAFT_809157 [Macrolepiota fuliginosa MF-IS2]|uniref:Uncharacterized protein n=1 Tax=Macrolepiota fuliginosa MF-IS2 TaxID=1400762 RepID=A0A9P6C6K6_9AGAR|nr:hypothetical protein P691DRAFT_809157 [Macrolepiota fuliginosa MF-IS2]